MNSQEARIRANGNGSGDLDNTRVTSTRLTKTIFVDGNCLP